jgi:signal transduction histidine kinase
VSLRTRTLIAVAILVAIGIAGVVGLGVAIQGLETAAATDQAYASLLDGVSTMRNLMFEYIASGEAADAARVADQAAYVQGRIDTARLGQGDPTTAADLARVTAQLRFIEGAAHQLGEAGTAEPRGAVSRAELERGMYARATDAVSALLSQQKRASAITEAWVAQLRNVGLIAIVLASLLAAVAIGSVGFRLAAGLGALTEGLATFAAGDRSVRVDVGGRDEITGTAQAFNEMAELVALREDELALVNARLLAADRAKSRFTANMSHDLRTPLNSIIGFSSVLLQGMPGPLTEEQRRQIEFINRSGMHLKALVDDVLDLSRMDTIGWEPHPRSFRLEPLVGDVVDTVTASAGDKAVKVSGSVEPPGAWVVVDEDGVRRILTNLAGNAVKFTTEGSVTLNARVEADTLVFDVSDTGPGISAEDLERIFLPFEQGALDRNVAKEDGVGLGLAIASRIASVLGGRIDVDSVLGRGSTFTVTLPMADGRDRE